MMKLRGLAGIRLRMTDGKQGVHPVFLQLRKSLPDLGRIEIPYPHVGEPHVCGRQHQVGKNYGRVGLGGVDPVTLPDPGLLVATAHDKDDRGVVAGMHSSEPGQSVLALDDPNPSRLAVPRGGGHAAGLKVVHIPDIAYIPEEIKEKSFIVLKDLLEAIKLIDSINE